MANLNDKLANKLFSVFSLHKSMDAQYHKAIEAIAAPDAWVDSFRIEDLTTAAAERRVWGYIHEAVEELDPYVTVSSAGQFVDYAVCTPANDAAITEILDRLERQAREMVLRFYRPNSTSNIDVEMKLREFAAWHTLYRALIGEL
jgi:hypothetical protein